MAEIDIEGRVRDTLTEAGFSLTEEQIQVFVHAYPLLRAGADSLFAIDAVRYEEPAITFTATI
jgi:hypothetical protein